MRRLAALALPLVLITVAAAAPKAPLVVIEKHAMTVSLDPATHGIRVRDRMTVRGRGMLTFRLADTLALTAKPEVDGTPVDVERHEGAYLVPVGRQGTRVVEVSYAGTIHDPVKKAENLAFVVGDSTTGTIEEAGVFLSGSSRWFPGDGSMSTFDLEVAIPAPWRVISQGDLLSDVTADGKNVTRWRGRQPSDQLYLQAGRYHITRRKHGEVTLGVALRQPNPPVAKLFLDEMASYLDLYLPLLGSFPHSRFEVVENFFTSGYGMPGYTLLGGDVIRHIGMMTMRNRGKIPPGYIDHELMHGWWGNGVYVKYDEGNWCEGLTSYCTNYYRKELESPEEARKYRQRVCHKYSVMVTPEKEYPVRAFRGKTEDFENDIGYGKCSMIFHMVRRDIGDDAFWGGLRLVAERFRGKRAGWEDLRTCFEETSKRDLKAFFTQWLDRKGGPVLAIEKLRREGNDLEGEIVQSGDAWRMPIEVRGVAKSFAGGSARVAIGGERTPFGVAGEKAALDPDWHAFRLYAPEAIPACLNATLADRTKLVVPADGVDAYAAAAKRAVGQKGGEVRADEDVTAADLERSLFLLGAPWENGTVKGLLETWGGPVKIEENAITILGTRHEGKALSLLLSFRNPWNHEHFVTVYLDVDRTALRRAPRFFFYGWDGYVLYDGGRPVDRGSLEPSRDVVEPVTEGAEESGRLLRELTDPKLRGRGAAASGARKAEALVAREMYLAGLSVRRHPFSFEVLDWKPAMTSVEVVGTGRKIALRPAPWCPDLDGKELGTDEVRLGTLPAADDHRKWSTFAYPSALPEVLRTRLDASKSSGRPTDPWWFCSGTQSRALEGAEARVEFVGDPGSWPAPGSRLKVSTRFERRRIASANVVGLLEGTDSDAGAVVVGAHYDGLGKHGDTVFASADDNASGVTALILAAKRLAAAPRPKRTVAFVAFGAEEWGLRGSTAFVRDLPLGKRKIVAMVNLDTVGRKGVKDVFVIGRSKHPALAEKAIAAITAAGFGTGRDIDRFAFDHGSDHWPFHGAGIPAIDLWASDYKVMNSAADTLADVDPAKIERLAEAVAGLLRTLADD